MKLTERQIRKWVLAGAMHPIALVREPLARHIREKLAEWWSDLDPYAYPWPAEAPTLRDAVSATCQELFYGVSLKRRWNMTNQVWMEIFGEHRWPSDK